MRLEKLSENQIRCTLDREDLVTRGLRLSELAYGTEKAKGLLHGMMQQASYEFGFDAEDLPLMIEAIPASLDRLILVITKVEDPDELDTRFSKFSPDPLAEGDYDDFDDPIDDLLECLGHPDSYMTTSETDSAEADFIPLPDCLGLPTNKEKTDSKSDEKPKRKTTPDMMKVYTFSSLSDISTAAIHLIDLYHGENRVYKNTHTGTYHLVLFRSGHTTEEFGKACNLLSEYARQERTTYATLAHMEEHYEPILRQDALAILAVL